MNIINSYRFAAGGITDPTTISGNTLWLDGQDSSTIFDSDTGGSTPSDGGLIGRWEDKSGNSNHGVQTLTGTTNRLVYQTSDATANSFASILGAATTSKLLLHPSFTMAECWFVVYYNSLTNPRTLLSGGGSGGAQRVIAQSGLTTFQTGTKDIADYAQINGGSNTNVICTSSLSVIRVVFEVTRTQAWRTMGTSGNPWSWGGAVTEIIGFDNIISEDDRVGLNQGLMDKYNIT